MVNLLGRIDLPFNFANKLGISFGLEEIKMKAKYSKYFFKHIMIYFEPSVLILPFAFYFNRDAIQLSCLWFSIVYYYNKQYD